MQYLNTASALNLAVSQRLGDSRPGLSLAGARTTTGATYTGHDAAALSQPPSAVLERLVDALLKPVASQTLHPALAPLPSDQSRSHETHRPHTAAAVAQHRLRTFSKSSALLGLGEALDAPPADGESELTKARFMYLRNGDGGRSVIQLRYADEPAGDDALPVAALPDVAPPARFQSTTQTPGGYRPRTASEYTRGALAMRFDGAQTLSAMRKLAPDYLVGVRAGVRLYHTRTSAIAIRAAHSLTRPYHTAPLLDRSALAHRRAARAPAAQDGRDAHLAPAERAWPCAVALRARLG